MVTAEEKRDIIKKIIELSYESDKSLETLRILHILLLRDTNGGKLYKYRSFDKKGYAIKNLKTGTLHCAKPNTFNDPFDCKIGITFSSLIKEAFGPVFELMNDIFDIFINVLQERIPLQDCTSDEQRIIKKLLTSQNLISFAKEHCQLDLSDTEKGNLLKEHSYVLLELMQIIIADEAFSSSLGNLTSILPKTIDGITPAGMQIMLDDNATYEDFAKAIGIAADTDEIGITLRMSEKILPDQQEARDAAVKMLDNLELQLTERINQAFLVGCLCTDYKNRLMWSHYADSHAGFCIEYDFSDANLCGTTNLPLPIYYSEERPVVPWKVIIENTPDNIAAASKELVLGVLTKDKAWEYENEWRILIS